MLTRANLIGIILLVCAMSTSTYALTGPVVVHEKEPNGTYAEAHASGNTPESWYDGYGDRDYSDLNGTVDPAGNGDIDDYIDMGSFPPGTDLELFVEADRQCTISIAEPNGAALFDLRNSSVATVTDSDWIKQPDRFTCYLNVLLFSQQNVIVELHWPAHYRTTYRIKFEIRRHFNPDGKVYCSLWQDRIDASYTSNESVTINFGLMSAHQGNKPYISDVFFLVMHKENVYSIVVDSEGKLAFKEGIEPIVRDYPVTHIEGSLPPITLPCTDTSTFTDTYYFVLVTRDSFGYLGQDWRLSPGEIGCQSIVVYPTPL